MRGMSVAADVFVGGVALWVLACGAVARACASSRQTALLRRRRFVARAEPELLDGQRPPGEWIAEAEEDFEAHQDYPRGQAETQRRRELNRIRNLGA